MNTSTFVGTGFAYLQSKLLKPMVRDDKKNADAMQQERIGNLSEGAKRILLNLLTQESVELKNYQNKSLSNSMIPNMVTSMETSQQPKNIVNPTMSDETILDLAYNQDISLLGSILSVIDQYPNFHTSATIGSSGNGNTGAGSNTTTGSVSSNYILQRCALSVIPQKTPGLLSGREMIYAALHFLCQEYPKSSEAATNQTATNSDTTSTFIIQLPLIQSTSMSNDIER
jgi:hypothetical protein